MRRLTTCLISGIFIACGGSSDPGTIGGDPDGEGGAGASAGVGAGGSTGSGGIVPDPVDPLDFPNDDDFDEDATGDDLLDPTITGATMLSADDGSIIGITRDDRIVYSTDATFSVKAVAGAPARKVASQKGTVHIKGETIFTFTDVDYDTGLADLTYWTPAFGRRSVGTVVFGDSYMAARADAGHVIFVKPAAQGRLNLVVASADKTKAQVLVEGAGRGSADTCAPRFGFAGQAAVVAWCETGETKATLARFLPANDGSWQMQEISDEASGFWTADASGNTLFYLASNGEGRVTDMANDHFVGKSVGWGMLDPTGQTVFFSVGDQLRRMDMNGQPIPIVVDGFSQRVGWSHDLGQVLYSSTVDYDTVTRQDLRTSGTDWFNQTPTILVSQPIAVLGRSVITGDGTRAIYTTDPMDDGATLHVKPLTGQPGITVPKTENVLAASGSYVLFTNNKSDPATYPILVDLNLIDASATPAVPQLLEAGIVDGRSFQVRSDKAAVIFRRGGAPDDGGIWARPLPVVEPDPIEEPAE